MAVFPARRADSAEHFARTLLLILAVALFALAVEADAEDTDGADDATPGPVPDDPPVHDVGEVSVTATRGERDPMRVAGNVTVLERAEIDARVEEVAATLQLSELLDRRPGKPSGGQRQRVAMGRALARSPQVFLFDEPLSNLHASLRVEMLSDLAGLHSPGPGPGACRFHRAQPASRLESGFLNRNHTKAISRARCFGQHFNRR